MCPIWFCYRLAERVSQLDDYESRERERERERDGEMERELRSISWPRLSYIFYGKIIALDPAVVYGLFS